MTTSDLDIDRVRERVRQLMTEQGISQHTLAKRMQTDQGWVSAFLAGSKGSDITARQFPR